MKHNTFSDLLVGLPVLLNAALCLRGPDVVEGFHIRMVDFCKSVTEQTDFVANQFQRWKEERFDADIEQRPEHDGVNLEEKGPPIGAFARLHLEGEPRMMSRV